MIRAALATEQQVAPDYQAPGKDEFLENKHEANDNHDRLVVNHSENELSNFSTKLPDINQTNTSRLIASCRKKSSAIEFT